MRLTAEGRLGGIDLARGLAVIGMLAAHLLWIDPFSWADASTWVDVVNGRSSILFATLAGVSIALVTGGRTPVRGKALSRARRRLAVRAAIIWAIGLALILTGVPVYVILPAYAILFLLALPVLSLRARALLVIGAGLALIMPFFQFFSARLPIWTTDIGGLLDLVIGGHYPFLVWSAFVITGLGVGRLNLRSLRTQLILGAIGVALTVLGYTLGAVLGPAAAATATAPGATVSEQLEGAVFTAEAHSSGLFEVIGSGGFGLAVLALCLLVCRTPLTWIVLPLRAVGSMPLTAYAGQIVAWAIAAALILGDTGDLRGFRDLDPFWWFVAWTVAGCTAWALLIGRGPLEAGVAAVVRRAVG